MLHGSLLVVTMIICLEEKTKNLILDCHQVLSFLLTKLLSVCLCAEVSIKLSLRATQTSFTVDSTHKQDFL